MSRRQYLMLVGVWLLILAVPGFPGWLHTALLVATGIGVIAFGYRMKPGGADGSSRADLPFTDYKPADYKPPEKKADEGTVA